MSFAIHTKYISPTNTKGARIKATCVRDRNCKWSVSVSFDHALDQEARHAEAVKALIAKHVPNLKGEKLWCCGSTLDNLGFVFSVYPTEQA